MDQNHNGSETTYNYSSSSALHFPLISNNSFELNAISLSDDSGFASSHQNRENEVSFCFVVITHRRRCLQTKYFEYFSMQTSTQMSLKSFHNSIQTLE